MDLWAVARYDLHVSEAEFWRMTLREFEALAERHRLAEERADFRAGLICSVLANVNRDPRTRKQPFTPWDFMPGGKPRGTPVRRHERMNDDEMKAMVQLLNAAFGGRVAKRCGDGESV